MTATAEIARDPHRNLALEQLARVLQDQSARSLDIIAGSGAIRCIGGRLVIEGIAPILGPDGVTMSDGTYAINDIANTGIADKLGIPGAYLRKLAEEFPDLYDQNVNGWLTRTDRRFLLRALRTDRHPTGSPNGRDEVDGTLRAFLSDRYGQIDNLDVLMAALDGVRASGARVEVEGCDLTDRRMHMRVYSPDVQVMAPALLARYRSPFDSRPGSELPAVWGGFVISNSETGCGRFRSEPRLMVQVCRNGMVMENSGFGRTHLGSRYDGEDGIVQRSAETLTKTLELITAHTRDAVAAYLDTDYVTRMIRDLETVSGKPVDDPDTTLKVVSSKLNFTDTQRDSILNHFIKGADPTAGGIMHAITSVAQTLPDADDAHRLETSAVRALHLAAATH
ncbi:MAG TPA: DUF932 domain-containing protein [Propionibacteriaceae bacterium]|nr:DUF932 domain-containing protein [Propionibacteriaceae bacterium]